jgi:adenylate kinase family enzyme
MVILIAGSSHTGKTLLAQKLLEKYKYPYLSIDHLKMGLIRSGNTELTVEDDDKLIDYLWNIVKEIIKTNIENNQNIIIEGCYIPFNWKESFDDEYLKEIQYVCLIMTENYIRTHWLDIKIHGNAIEKRKYEDVSQKELITDNNINLEMCKKYNHRYILIDDKYEVDYEL